MLNGLTGGLIDVLGLSLDQLLNHDAPRTCVNGPYNRHPSVKRHPANLLFIHLNGTYIASFSCAPAASCLGSKPEDLLLDTIDPRSRLGHPMDFRDYLPRTAWLGLSPDARKPRHSRSTFQKFRDDLLHVTNPVLRGDSLDIMRPRKQGHTRGKHPAGGLES